MRKDLSNSRTGRGFNRLEVAFGGMSVRDIKAAKRCHVPSPPWTSSPPESTEPDTALLHVAQCTIDGLDTLVIGSSANFSKDGLEAMSLEPLCGSGKTLNTNSGRDASGIGTLIQRSENLILDAEK